MMMILTIHLLISLGTLLTCENIEGIGVGFFFIKFGIHVYLGGFLINL